MFLFAIQGSECSTVVRLCFHLFVFKTITTSTIQEDHGDDDDGEEENARVLVEGKEARVATNICKYVSAWRVFLFKQTCFCVRQRPPFSQAFLICWSLQDDVLFSQYRNIWKIINVWLVCSFVCLIFLTPVERQNNVVEIMFLSQVHSLEIWPRANAASHQPSEEEATEFSPRHPQASRRLMCYETNVCLDRRTDGWWPGNWSGV